MDTTAKQGNSLQEPNDMPSFNKILVANRGEIAYGAGAPPTNFSYRSVAVYSEADADARHVQLADEADGLAAVAQSYSSPRGDP